MQAICFECGEAKKLPLQLCSHCQAVPKSRSDQITSFALSAKCLRDQNLERAGKYIKRKKRLPRFHENVSAKATKIFEEQQDPSSSELFELSDSFFDFTADTKERTKNETVTVHAIGKPPGADSRNSGPVSREKTYQTLKWEIGKEISEEEAKTHMDAFGCIYVWFRWQEGGWTWRFVSKSDFEKLRRVGN